MAKLFIKAQDLEDYDSVRFLMREVKRFITQRMTLLLQDIESRYSLLIL